MAEFHCASVWDSYVLPKKSVQLGAEAIRRLPSHTAVSRLVFSHCFWKLFARMTARKQIKGNAFQWALLHI